MPELGHNMKNAAEKHALLTYFDSNIYLLKITGFWFYERDAKVKKTTKYLQHCYNAFWFFYLFIAYFPAEILFLFYSFNNLDLFLRSLRDLGNHVSLIYKALNYFFMKKHLFELIGALQNGNYEYEDFENFKPKYIVEKEKKQALKWTKYFLIFCNAICLTMFASGMVTFIFLSDTQYVVHENVTIYAQPQPVNTVSPFGVGTKLQFFLSFIYTIIALTFFAWMIVALDSLYITLMSCISGHLKILQGAFRTLHSRCIKRMGMDSRFGNVILHDSPHLQNAVNEEMVKCVKHLQTVFRVSVKLESIYSTQTFVQTFISLGEMCFSLYLLSENLDQSLGNEVTYLIATGFELLMYCWFGNRITEASIQLSYALYDSDWFATSHSYRKQIILSMTRMQKPIYVTIGKITPLTFNTFLTIARGAYSFFTFLKQRHGIHHKV